MSVPVFQRSENKLQVLKDTMTMTKYTIQMCENEKVFPKKSRWTLCTRIIDTCLDSIIKIRQANKVKVETADIFSSVLKMCPDLADKLSG